jgi:hypothetical protein
MLGTVLVALSLLRLVSCYRWQNPNSVCKYTNALKHISGFIDSTCCLNLLTERIEGAVR